MAARTKKPAAKKTAKKTVAAKKTAKKTVATKAAKKGAAKKGAAKKPAAKKPAAKKTAKKLAAKKPAGAQKPLDLLLSDVSSFNAWRMEHRDAPLELAGVDLSGADLREALLAGAALDGATLDDADLRGALLAGASMVGASMRRADLRGACFGHAELMSAELLNTRLGDALVRSATLRGASLEGARANDAVFVECDLGDALVTDCDFTGADLRRTALEEAAPPAPPSVGDDDRDALWARFRAETVTVREGILRAALLVFLAGAQSDEGAGFLSGLAAELELTQDDVDRVMPSGQVVLEQIGMAPPSSQWARRMILVLLFGVIQTAEEVAPMQLQVLGHFGELLGFSDRAMTRLIAQELGIEVSIAPRA